LIQPDPTCLAGKLCLGLGLGLGLDLGMNLWRGDLSPFGCAAVVNPANSVYLPERWGRLRHPTGINPLATIDPTTKPYVTDAIAAK
jgi:hypothetical protein